MSKEIEARVGGYRWALTQEQGAEYNELASFGAFIEVFPPSEPGDNQHELFAEWEIGVWDTHRLTRDDAMMSVAEVVETAKLNRSYVKAEIARGNLKAYKEGRDWRIYPQDFREWLNNPKRGSRSKSE